MKQRFRDNLLLLFGALLLLVVVIADKPSQASFAYGRAASLKQASEYEIKAVYLYNFLLFTEWPKANDAKNYDNKKPAETICIGILGDNPFGGVFKEVEGKTIEGKGKKLVIKYFGRYKENKDITDCQVLFISSSEKKNVKHILKRLSGKPILTVADMNKFVESGGMVNFVKAGKKIRWEVNSTPVKLAGLKLSSQLLRNSTRIVEIPKLSAGKSAKVAGLYP
ncbi:MAG: YfiR family protein [Planctomycetes bacterium]|nr:YfiR family protein [Planctomycetota bacterium]